MSESSFVFNADAASFQSLVIDASHRVPVLVDFWAQWCGPCRALAPVLEKLANEFQGRFLLVKIDTDREQEVARQFGIRSLPTVKVFKDGSAVDEFLGAQPESQVRALLERHLTRESDDARVQAQSLRDRGELNAARALLEQAHVSDPDNQNLIPDLANVLIDLGELDLARKALGLVSTGIDADAEVRAAADRLTFAELAATAPPMEELERAVAVDACDCQSLYLLAVSHVARGEYASALDKFIEILRIDRGFRDDAGRKGLLSVFEILGNDHELVGRYRARMSSLLY
ncbi:MAG: thioredoxin [Gammaproteobacteria bacterium]|nr:thioredoxin [Gammaproteobacteria bacterium]MDX2462740.1 thioredoxin [Gammaproteobacteria bacterium]